MFKRQRRSEREAQAEEGDADEEEGGCAVRGDAWAAVRGGGRRSFNKTIIIMQQAARTHDGWMYRVTIYNNWDILMAGTGSLM